MTARMMAHARAQPIGRTREMHMALTTHRWTRADLARLPDDSNNYEVIDGELLVSPAPFPSHESLVRALRRALEPYCDHHGLGVYCHEPAVVTEDSEVMPDLVIREPVVPPPDRWDDAPTPLLVVEVMSEATRRHDRIKKRAFYMEIGIPEYWIVDGDTRTFSIVSPGREDRVVSGTFAWAPAAAVEPLDVDVVMLFRSALG
jgi:Uma2 family endonuclease